MPLRTRLTFHPRSIPSVCLLSRTTPLPLFGLGLPSPIISAAMRLPIAIHYNNLQTYPSRLHCTGLSNQNLLSRRMMNHGVCHQISCKYCEMTGQVQAK